MTTKIKTYNKKMAKEPLTYNKKKAKKRLVATPDTIPKKPELLETHITNSVLHQNL